MSQSGLKKWYAFFERHDPSVLDEVLADDAVFESPVVHTPQRGKEIVRLYLASAGEVLDNGTFEYVNEWTNERSAVLEFRTVVDGITINGVDMITWNEDDKISHFKVMVRPLKAMNKVHQKMGELLAAAAS